MAKQTESASAAEGKKKVSKAEAVRRSLQENGWDASLDTHEKFIQSEFGIQMPRIQISQYKSSEKRRTGRGRRRRGRRPEGAEVVNGGATGPRSDTLLAFITTVRRWEEKLGSKKLLDVIDALYKKSPARPE